MVDAYEYLVEAKQRGKLPQLTVFLRIDGPGSSLDMRLWQQSFWKLTHVPQNPLEEPSMSWSGGLPRTIGISINVGIDIIAEPIAKGKLCVESVDYGFCYTYEKGSIPPMKESWLLRIMEIFDLDGVKFTVKNQNPALKSAGLGGSAAVTTGVCLLANLLTGSKFSETQLIGMASMIEQDFGVSLTGTQEQSCVMFGGVRDYVWFPFGVPNQDNFYGKSINQEIVKPENYHEIEQRMDVYFCIQRHSSDVNAKWTEELKSIAGFKLHAKKLELAYKYREALRTKNWFVLSESIEEYRKIRTQLCNDYMSDSSIEINRICQEHNAVCFPLGGGGGSVMVFAPNPKDLLVVREILSKKFKRIEYQISERGYKLENF